MREVTKDEFFKAVGGPRNIHPTPKPDHSLWIDQRSLAIVGKTTPGWQLRGPIQTKRYFLATI